MKRTVIVVTLLSLLSLAATSCGGNTSGEPVNAAEARELASGSILPETPDTVFLDYHWNMTKKEADALTDRYVKAKKLKRDMFGGIHYDLTLKNAGKVSSIVSFDFHNDSLSVVSIILDNYEYGTEATLTDYYLTFSQMFRDKGYTEYSEECNPFFKQPAYVFFKGNTSVTFVYFQGMNAMVFTNEYSTARQREENTAAADARKTEAEKALEEGAKRTRNDF